MSLLASGRLWKGCAPLLLNPEGGRLAAGCALGIFERFCEFLDAPVLDFELSAQQVDLLALALDLTRHLHDALPLLPSGFHKPLGIFAQPLAEKLFEDFHTQSRSLKSSQSG